MNIITLSKSLKSVIAIRIGCNADPDPDAHPEPQSKQKCQTKLNYKYKMCQDVFYSSSFLKINNKF